MFRIALLWISLTFLQGQVFSQSSELLMLENSLDGIMEEGINNSAFPGAQILVRFRDSVYFHKTWGHHTYDDITPVRRDDIYDMASVTKVSSGLPILMQLFGKNSLDLDAPISQYIPSLRRSNKRDLSLRQILTHQARLQPYIVFWQEALKKNGKYKGRSFKNEGSSKYPIRITENLYLHKRYKQKMAKAIKNSEVKGEAAYLYSGLIFLLMPDLITDIVNEPFESYLYREIYDKIGAKTLKYNPLKYFKKERLVPTEFDSLWRKGLVHGTVHDEAAAMLGGVSCNAGLFGSAEDLSKLFQLYLNKGKWEGQAIIHSEAVEIFTSYQYVGNRRGLGFDKPLHEFNEDLSYISRHASKASFGHSGFTGTFVWADPEHDLVVVFLSNRVYPNRSKRNLYKLNIRPRFHDAIYEWVKKVRIANHPKGGS